jgi:hypothetical protein
VRKRRGKVGTCLNPDQRPKLRPPVRIRGGPRLNVVAYAGVFGEGHRHALLTSILTPPAKRERRETSMEYLGVKPKSQPVRGWLGPNFPASRLCSFAAPTRGVPRKYGTPVF